MYGATQKLTTGQVVGIFFGIGAALVGLNFALAAGQHVYARSRRRRHYA